MGIGFFEILIVNIVYVVLFLIYLLIVYGDDVNECDWLVRRLGFWKDVEDWEVEVGRVFWFWGILKVWGVEKELFRK